MQLTPYLESLIHQGKAKWNMFNGAVAGVYRLQIPNKHYIIITEVQFIGGILFPGRDGATPVQEADVNQNYKIWIRSSEGSQFNLIHRTPMTWSIDPFSPAGVQLAPSQPSIAQTWNVYSPHAGLLKIAVGVIDDVNTWATIDFIVPPANVNEEGGGLSTYQTSATLGLLNIGAGVNMYNPMTQTLNPEGGTNMEMFTPQANPLLIPTQMRRNNNYCILHIGYVEVFEPLPSKIER